MSNGSLWMELLDFRTPLSKIIQGRPKKLFFFCTREGAVHRLYRRVLYTAFFFVRRECYISFSLPRGECYIVFFAQ